MSRKKISAGFTLIETLVYLALFAIVIGGGIVAVYNIIEGTNANRNQAILQEEANFLLRKVDWALTGATSITTPAAAASGGNLVINKSIGGVSTTLTFSTCVANYVCLQRAAAPAQSLNSGSIKVTNLKFQRSTSVPGKPDAITTTFTLTTAQNGRTATQNFSTTKYLRK